MKFNRKYTEYWKNNLANPIDGIKIADIDEAKYFLTLFDVKQNDYLLDLGCSFGRMYSLLNEFSEFIYGLDPDPFAVEKASLVGYIEAKVGSAENSTFKNNFFDKIFSWAVFDCVDHFKGLLEANRILKLGGKILLTGKNDNYFKDDSNAFVAEKNAYLKSFDNHFVDMNLFVNHIGKLGFKIEKLFIFPRRGDFGKLIFTEQDIVKNSFQGYEYLMILEKIDNVQSIDYRKLDASFSKTALKISKDQGFSSIFDYFETIGLS